MRLGDLDLDMLMSALYRESQRCMRRGAACDRASPNFVTELTTASVLGSLVNALQSARSNMQAETEREMRRRMEQDTGEQP